MKLILICTFILSFGNAVLAQQSDERANKILNEVSKQYEKYKSLKADFTQTLENKQDDFEDSQSGTLYIKNEKFRLKLGAQDIICDNDHLWTYFKDVNEVQVDNYRPEEMQINPSEIFTMHEEGFLERYAGEKTIDGKTHEVIELTPTDKEQAYFKVKLYILPNENRINKAEIFEKNGNIYIYKINDFEANPGLEDSFFKFNKKQHPGVSVIDLR